MQKLLPIHREDAVARPAAPVDLSAVSASLVEVLWRRRWTVLASVGACLLLALIVLASSTPVYRATARIAMQQNGPRILGGGDGAGGQSDNFLQTQADVLASAPVLTRALDAAGHRTMRTFDGVSSPVDWLQRGGALAVEPAKRSDVITVSLESPHPDEAVALTASIVNAYIAELTQRQRTVGREMVTVLEQERDELRRRRELIVRAMVEHAQKTGVMSFGTDAGNTVMERTAAVSSSLTGAELDVVTLRARADSIRAVLDTPSSTSAYVTGQQFQGREFGDQEYDELRRQHAQHLLAESVTNATLGPKHPRRVALQSVIDQLEARIRAKERAIVQAQLTAALTDLAAAEQKEGMLRAALGTQRQQADALTPEAAQHARLAADAAQLQRQSELIEARIAEVTANNIRAEPLNVHVLEPARATSRPVKPNKSLALAAALLAGGLVGIGLALLRDWGDARLRSPEEVMTLLSTPVLGSVPRSNPRLSAVARGQLVHLDARSVVAEAYRSIRAAVHLGPHRNCKSILIASPVSDDGKSTTASNLAIAFAQSGERTLVIDCDLREPVQHLIFDCAGDRPRIDDDREAAGDGGGSAGLSGVLAGVAKLRDTVHPTRIPRLYVLPCGPAPENPAELLAGKRFGRVLAALGKAFDRIIIDSPPLLSTADARVLAASADAALLVLRMNWSVRQSGVLALECLERVGANVIGVVANDVTTVNEYHDEGGAHQYAAERIRLPLPALGVDPTGGHGPHGSNGSNGSNGNGSNKTPPVDEPDWTVTSR